MLKNLLIVVRPAALVTALIAAGCSPLLQVPEDVEDRYPVRGSRTGLVDFHNHTVLKPYSQLIEKPSDTSKFQLSGVRMAAWTLNTAAEDSLKGAGGFSSVKTYRQSDWGKLANYRLVCTSIYPTEKGLMTDESGFYRWLKPMVFSGITGASKNRRRGMMTNWAITPFDEFRYEENFMLAQESTPGPGGNTVRVLRSRQELQALVLAASDSVTGLVLSIEGGHVLLGKSAQGTPKRNRLLLEKTDSVDVQEMLGNIERLKHWPRPVFFITFSHIIWNKLAGNANALDTEKNKLTKVGLRKAAATGTFRRAARTQPNTGVGGISPFSYDDAAAVEEGLIKGNPKWKNATYDNGTAAWVYYPENTLGRLALLELLNQKSGRRILPDMRHASIKTRLDYYYLLDSLRKADHDTIPVLFSHAAASGEAMRLATLTGLRPHSDRYDEIDNPATYYRDLLDQPMPLTDIPRYKPYFGRSNASQQLDEQDLPKADDLGWFQPSSVNLANEEMDIVCASGGLVGLTLEQRALGTSMPRWTKDQVYGRVAIEKMLRDTLAQQFPIYTKNQDQEEFIRRFLVAAPFFRNLSHLVLATSEQYDPWRHIGIGSDFDGLIDPLDYFHTSDRLPELEQFMIDNFALYCRLYKQPMDRLLTRRSHTYTAEEAMRRVFSLNGIAFISRHYPE